jgi:hypothetical protein
MCYEIKNMRSVLDVIIRNKKMENKTINEGKCRWTWQNPHVCVRVCVQIAPVSTIKGNILSKPSDVKFAPKPERPTAQYFV